MASSDLSVLVDMGFEKERAELAVKKTGGCECTHLIFLDLVVLHSEVLLSDPSPVQGALQWLEDNQDKSLDEIKAASAPKSLDEADDPNAEPPALKEGEIARSLICNVCGKRFRSTAQAEFHASKTFVDSFNPCTNSQWTIGVYNVHILT